MMKEFGFVQDDDVKNPGKCRCDVTNADELRKTLYVGDDEVCVYW
jgi:hypothetical protein